VRLHPTLPAQGARLNEGALCLRERAEIFLRRGNSKSNCLTTTELRAGCTARNTSASSPDEGAPLGVGTNYITPRIWSPQLTSRSLDFAATSVCTHLRPPPPYRPFSPPFLFSLLRKRGGETSTSGATQLAPRGVHAAQHAPAAVTSRVNVTHGADATTAGECAALSVTEHVLIRPGDLVTSKVFRLSLVQNSGVHNPCPFRILPVFKH
jgi:hypothetical protein